MQANGLQMCQKAVAVHAPTGTLASQLEQQHARLHLRKYSSKMNT